MNSEGKGFNALDIYIEKWFRHVFYTLLLL